MVTLRIIALRKSAGRFLDEPNNVYMKMREVVNKRQTTINDLFFCKDEATSFVVNLMLCVISKKHSYWGWYLLTQPRPIGIARGPTTKKVQKLALGDFSLKEIWKSVSQ